MKKQIICTILLTIILLLFQSSFSCASSLGSIISGADNFIQAGTGNPTIADSEIKNLSNTIYNILLTIGTILAVIIGAVLGIQFMVGSVEQKSKIKEALIPYFVGCAVIFGAFGIWKLAVSIGKNLSLTQEEIAAQVAEQQRIEQNREKSINAQIITNYLQSKGLNTIAYGIDISDYTDSGLESLWRRYIAEKRPAMMGKSFSNVEEILRQGFTDDQKKIYYACEAKGLVANGTFELITDKQRSMNPNNKVLIEEE